MNSIARQPVVFTSARIPVLPRGTFLARIPVLPRGSELRRNLLPVLRRKLPEGCGGGEYKWGFPLSLCCVQRKLRAIYHHPERVPFTNSPFTSHEGEKSVNTRGDSFAAALASCSLFPSLCFLTSRAVWPPRSSWQNYHSACAAVQQKL